VQYEVKQPKAYNKSKGCKCFSLNEKESLNIRLKGFFTKAKEMTKEMRDIFFQLLGNSCVAKQWSIVILRKPSNDESAKRHDFKRSL
jgi:hypothetical protein